MIQVFVPGAKEVSVKIKGGKKTYPMDLEDEAGFFSVLIPGKRIPSYTYVVTFENGAEQESADPYSFAPQITEKDTKKFNAGICYNIYEKLGCASHDHSRRGRRIFRGLGAERHESQRGW